MQLTYRHLELATVKTLRSLLSREIETYRTEARRCRLLLMFATLLFLSAYSLIAPTSVSEAGRVGLMIIWVVLPFLTARYEAKRTSHQRVHDIVTVLYRYEARSSVGVLIEAMEIGAVQTVNVARLAVIAILPKLTLEDAPLLQRRHRAYLHRALRGGNSEFILAILSGLEQVGDPAAIRYVQNLVPGPVWLWDYDRIEQSAKRCLSVLHERKDRQQVKQTLLRVPSDRSASANALLRPAQGRPANSLQYEQQGILSPEIIQDEGIALQQGVYS